MPAELPDQASTPFAVFTPTIGVTGAAEIPILKPIVMIGQGAQNDVVLDDDTVSTKHARLEYVEGSWRLTDLDSRNGTFVDGNRLSPGVAAELPDQAEVAFGIHQLQFAVITGANPALARQRFAPSSPKASLADRSGLRFPLWLVVIILIVLALLIGMVVWYSRPPDTVDPVIQPTVQLPAAGPLQLVA